MKKVQEGYQKYQHIEKIGTKEAQGILLGDVYVFPKIDGTNAQAWSSGGVLHYGSRNRELTLDKDNAGFMQAMAKNDQLNQFTLTHPDHRVFGEWLVPHSLRTYEDDAWRKFYVFDIMYPDGTYMHYNDLQAVCELYGLEYIAPLRVIHNPTIDDLLRVLPENTYLIREGEGQGEGLVLKNYDFVNKYGRVCWAKYVTAEFKAKTGRKTPNVTKGTEMIEEAIVEKYVTGAEARKTYAKIVVENGGWESRMIPQLLGRCYHDLVSENMWEIVKKKKSPTINFKTLKRFCDIKVKAEVPDLF